MARTKKNQNALLFEELEPRLLFSADGMDALAAGIVEQDYAEEPADIADLNIEPAVCSARLDRPVEEENVPLSNPETTDPLAANADDVIKQEISDSVAGNELVFINSSVQDYQHLVDDLLNGKDNERSIEMVILDSKLGGFGQVTEILNQYENLDAIHFITHGSDSYVGIGNDWLNAESLQANKDDVADWGSALTETGDILFYGCNIAADSDGQRLLDSIAELTGADVTASNDRTGSAMFGGDWALEYTVGKVETNVAIGSAAQATWSGMLSTYIVNNTDDDGSGSLRQAIRNANTNPNSGGPDVIAFDIGTDGSQQTINLLSALDPISEAVIIDGFSQYGALTPTTPLIVLNGAGTTGEHGLVFDAGSDGSSVSGLAIVRFDGSGIHIESGADNITVAGNWIGTTGTGTTGDGNGNDGIDILGSNAIIGGLGANDGNVITNYGDEGINIQGSGVTGHLIQGNIIGLDPDGSTSSNNGDVGIAIISGSNNTIGGTTSAARNIISNNVEGIEINSNNNIVQGNYIGTDITGIHGRGNRSDDGVEIQSSATGNLIGGETPGSGNVIAYNAQNGVNLVNGTNNAVVRNSIHSNTLLGINQGSGANNNQNFPVLTSAVTNGSQITITGTLNSTASTSFRIEFYANVTGDPTGYGEGQTLIGISDVTTNSSGYASFSPTCSANVSTGSAISAIVSRLDNGDMEVETSEFAQNVIAVAGSTAPNAVNDSATVYEGDVVTINLANNDSAPDNALDLNSIVITSAPVYGSLIVNGDGTLTYTHDGSNTVNDSFEYTIKDVSGETSNTASVTLTVTPTSDQSVSIAENTIFVTSVSGNDGDTHIYQIVGGADAALFGFGGNPLSTTAPLYFFSAPDFENPTDDNGDGIYEVIVNSDGTILNFSVTVNNANDAPAGTNKTVTINEDAEYVFTTTDFGFTDPNDNPTNVLLAVKIATLPGAGNLTWNNGVSDTAVTAGQFITATDITDGKLKFTPVADVNGTAYASFTFQVQDDGGTANTGVNLDQSPNTITVDVTAINDTPVITLPGGAVNYKAGDGAVVIDGAAMVTDTDGGTFDSGNMTIDITANGTGHDRLAINDQGSGVGNITLIGSQVYYNFGTPLKIGDFTGGTDGSTPLVVTLTDKATLAAVQALMRNITYENVSENSSESARTVRFVLTDGDGGTSDAATETISVTAANDAPTDLFVTATNGGGLSINADGGNDTYLVADDGGAILGGLTGLTIESQFSISTQSFGETTLLSYASAGSDNEVKVIIQSTGELEFSVGTLAQVSSNSYLSLVDGEKHSVAVSWDSTTGSVAMYVDGSLAETFSGFRTGYTVAGGGTLLFGQEQDTLGGGFQTIDQFQGTLYDVRIFNDVRSAGEIAASYNQTLPYTESGLIANWTFNDLSLDATTGNRVVTDTISGNNLTAMNIGAGGGFISSTPNLTLKINENSANGTVVGRVIGTDAERDARIASLLAADPSLYYNAETGKFYKVDSGWHTPAEARTNAENSLLNGVNGQLVTIRSANENEFVWGLVDSLGARTWIGATDATVEGEWRWIEAGIEADQLWSGLEDGNAVNGAYQNWETGQPNQGGGEEDWAQMDNATGLWWDNKADTTHHFVTEWKADNVLDSTDPLTYAITAGNTGGGFTIDADTGGISVANNEPLDYETTPTFNLTVAVIDNKGAYATATVTVNLNDVNETPVNTVPGSQSINEDTALTFSAVNGNQISISDDSGETLTVIISVTNGTLLTSGAGTSTVINDGSAVVTLSGSDSDINATLDGLQYTSASNWNGSDTLTIATTDGEVYALNIDADLLGYYKFDNADPVNDSSPSGLNDGSFVGGATVVNDPDRGDVLSLDGSGDAVAITGLFGNAANVTLSAWVNLTAADIEGADVISLGDNVGLRLDNPNGGSGVWAYFNYGGGWTNIASGEFLAGDGWAHVAYVFDDTNNTHTIYINGEKIVSEATTASISYTSGIDTYIGTHGNGDTDYDFNGLIDDARVYTRALTETEIASLADAPAPPSATDTVMINVTAVNDAPVATDDPGAYTSVLMDLNPISYWRLGEADGAATAADIGSIANNGTYNGGTFGEAGAIYSDNNTAVRFDGSAYIEVPHVDDYLLDTGTVQLWFNTNTPATGDLQHLFSKDSLDKDTGGQLSIYLDGSGNLEARLQDSTLGSYYVTSLSAVTAGEWHHAAFSFGTSGMTLYLDGVSVDTDSYTGGLGTTSGGTGNFEPIAISGGTQESGDNVATPVTQLFTGLIDDVAIIGNQLNAQTIQQLYDSGVNQLLVNQDGTLNVSAGSGVLANDYDVDGDTLTVIEVNGSAVDVGTPVTLASGAQLTLYSDGSLEYNPNGKFDYLGIGATATETFTYTVSDGNGGTATGTGSITITVSGLNDAPVAQNDGVNIPLSLNPIAYWRLGEANGSTAVDETGTYDASYNGATPGAAGIVTGNTAADFDGIDGYVDAGVIDVNGTGLTLSTWFNADNFSTTDQRLISKATTTAEQDHLWMLSTVYDSGEYRLRIRISAGGTTDTLIATSGAISAGQWYHASATYDGSVMKLFLDGVEVGSAVHTVGGAIDTSDSASVFIGANPLVPGNSPEKSFDGRIDEVAVFDKALTPTEIQDLSSPSFESYVTTEDTPLIINVSQGVLNNDNDLDGDPLSAVLVSDAGSGSVSLNNDGSFTYTPGANFYGTDSFTYIANDGTVDGNVATVTIIVNALNDAPVIDSVSLSVGEGQTVTLGDTNFGITDPDGSNFSYTLSSVLGGYFQLSTAGGIPITSFTSADLTNGIVQFVDDGDEEAPSFSVAVNDGDVNSNTLAAGISYTAVNDAPAVTVVALGSIDEDGAININQADLLTGSSDVDGDPLTAINLALNTGSGSLTDHGDGTWTFTPTAEWNGAVSFDFDVFDGTVATANTASLTVNTVNDDPITSGLATQNLIEGFAAYSIDLKPIFADVETLDADLIYSVSGNTNIGVSIDGSGVATISSTANWNGTEALTFTAEDENGDTVNAAADFFVAAVNDDPTVDNSITDQSATEDTLFTFQFAADVFGDVDGDTLTYTSNAAGWLSFDAATRTFSGTPLNVDVGMTTVTITADDGNGGTVSDTFDIVISNTNDAPTVDNAITDQTATEDTAFTFQFATDVFGDVDGDSLTYTSDAAGWLSFDAATRTFSGTPLNADVGTKTVTVTADDSNGGTISDTFDIVVSNTNDAPVVDLDADNSSGAAGADYVTTFTENGGPVNIVDVLDASLYDADLEDLVSLTITLVNPLDGVSEFLAADTTGTVIVASYDSGTGVLSLTNADSVAHYEQVLKTVTYNNTSEDPDTAARGIMIVANDGTEGSGSVTWHPAAASGLVGYWNLNEGSGNQVSDLSGNGNNGTLTNMDPATDWVAGQTGHALQFDGINDYVEIPYSSELKLGGDFTITLWNKPDSVNVPTVTHRVMEYGKTQWQTDGWLINQYEDDLLWYHQSSGPVSRANNVFTAGEWTHIAITRSGDTFSLYVDGVLHDQDVKTGSITGNHSLYLGSDAGAQQYAGTIDDVRIYNNALSAGEIEAVYQDHGAMTEINIIAVNDAPLAVDDAITVVEDTVFTSTIKLDANDTDVDGDALTVLAGTFATTAGGSITIATDGSYTYTPLTNYTGTDSVDYTVTDSKLNDIGTLTITVTPINDAPIAVNDRAALNFDGVDDYIQVAHDTSLVMTDTLTLEAWINPDDVSALEHMILNKEGEYEIAILNGTIQWALANTNPGWSWHDTEQPILANQWTHIALSYNNGVAITYVNGLPIDTYSGSGPIGDAHETLDELRIGGRTNNPEGKYFDGQIADVRVWDTVRTQAEISANLGTPLTGSETGLVGYWLLNEGSGTDAIDSSLAGNDGLLGGGLAAQEPTWSDFTVLEDGTLNVSAPGVLINDIDVDGDTLTVNTTPVTDVAHGLLTLNGDGSFVYTPDADFFGTDSFTYKINDGTVDSNVATVTITVNPVNDVPVGVPTITGTATEDQLLTADTSGISDADGLGAFSYQWLRDGSDISGATSSTYTLEDADVGSQISVQVSYTDGNTTAEGPLTSMQTAVVTNENDAPVGLPVITGTATEDQILTADTSGISDADGLGAFSYQWLRDNSDISGATSSTYTLGDADVGSQISVQVSYTDGNSTVEGPLTSVQTAAVTNINDAPAGLPTITGTVTEDQVLTADTSGISDADGLGAFSYQWLRDNSDISGATTSTYTLGDADVGSQISVQASYTDGNTTAEGPLTSAQTAVVTNINDLPVGLPMITGIATENQILTADTSGISDADGLGAFSYQWLRDGSAIGGATSNSYTLGDADVGSQISVQVSYTDGNSTAEGRLTSVETAVVTNVNDTPVGIPTITGTATEDQVLTADISGISDADGLGAFSYQWLRDDSDIAGATTSTYTLGDADVGSQISVQVSYTDGNTTDEGPLTSAQTAVVTNVNDAPAGLPVITGTATEDQVLTADTSGISDADGLGAFSYQWLRDGSAIGGATSNSYTLGDADVGSQISVQVSYTDGNSTAEGPLTSATTAVVTNVNDTPVGIPTISGTASEDQVLSADTSGISDADGLGTFSYQWLRDGSSIAGATSSTYTLGDADVGSQISVQVSYTDGNTTDEGPLTSAQTSVVTNVNDTPVGIPTITGTATEDQVLTANTYGISDADGLGAFSYQWLRDNSDISGATSSTYTLGDADVGSQISVQVSYTDGNTTAEGPLTSAQTTVVTNVNDTPVGIPTITGTATEDMVLTADTSGISDADGLGAFSYQWLRDGSAIGGATSNSYTLGDADVGSQISVQVSYTDGNTAAEGPLTSAQTAVVTNVNDTPVGIPTITGTATEDQVLTADTSGISDADGLGAFSYQWLRDGSDISGATSSTYTLGDADVGSQISVQVSYTDGNTTAEGPLTSEQTAVVTNVNNTPVGLPVITGTATEDQILTVDTSGISDAHGLGAFSYQWLRDGSAIGGATSNSYTLGDADVGSQISVQVSYTDGNSTAEGPLTSAQTAAVTNVNDTPGAVTDTAATTENTAITIDVLANDTDLDISDIHTVSTIDTTGTKGTVLINTAGTGVSYNPGRAFDYLAVGETATDTFTYTIADGNGGTDAATVTVTITGTNDAPKITSTATVSAAENQTGVTAVKATDADGDTLTFSITGGTDSGFFSINSSGVLTFNRVQDFETFTDADNNGVYEVEMTAADLHGDTDTQTILVSLTDVNEIPTFASMPVITATEDVLYSYTITTHDVDGDALTITAASLPDWLSLSDNGDGTATLLGIPGNAEVGDHTVVLIVSDGSLLSANQSFTITVNNTNDAAVIGGTVTASITEDVNPGGNNLLEANGVLTINDPDVGQSSFIADSVSGTYGNLTIDTAGNWRYAADNSQTAIQQLSAATSVTDTLTVTAADGTTQNIIITINGANEVLIHYNNPTDIDDEAVPDTGGTEDTAIKEQITTESPPDDETDAEDATAPAANPANTDAVIEISKQDNVSAVPKELVTDYYIEADILPTATKSYSDADKQIQKDNFVEIVMDGIKLAENQALDFISAPLSAAPVYLETTDLNGSVIENKTMQAQLDIMQHEIDQTFEEEAAEQKISVYMTSGISASLAAGAVSYLLRAGSLMSSFLATVPIWKGFDPVAILLVPKKKKRKDEGTTQDSADQPGSAADQKAENMFSVKETQ